MNPRLSWHEGAETIRDPVETWWQDPNTPALSAREIARSRHRRVIHLQPHGQAGIIVKCFRDKSGPLAWIQRALGRAPWQRERWGLEALAGISNLAPTFLGLTRTSEGETWVISEFIPGPSLWATLNTDNGDRALALAPCGPALARLHQAGVAHGDLHPDNILLGESGPILIDFQRSSKRRRRTRTDDLARLDFSLALIDIPEDQRHHLIDQALGGEDHAARKRPLILRRSRKLADRHRKIRMRHSLRPSDERAPLQWERNRGLRRMDFSEDELRLVLRKGREPGQAAERRSDTSTTPVQSGERLFYIHEQRARSMLGRLRQGLLGSPARRAWQKAHDPQAPEGGLRTLAFSEHRILGLPASSLWVVEDRTPVVASPMGKEPEKQAG